MNDAAYNPPVFPTIDANEAGLNGTKGVTLLDWYAGQAIAGLMADVKAQGSPEQFANSAFVVAEAMLEIRKARSKMNRHIVEDQIGGYEEKPEPKPETSPGECVHIWDTSISGLEKCCKCGASQC